MKNVLKYELIRAYTNIYFAAAVLIGCAITLADISNVLKFYNVWSNYPPSLYQYWICTEFKSSMIPVYFMLAPLLASLPFADSYFRDRRGYIKQIITRTSRLKYLASKYLAVFISGGTAFALPLVVNFIAIACICPALAPQATTGTFATYENGFMSLLFINHPLIYCIFYIILDFILAGLLATVALTAALFIKNRFAVLLSPFILFLLISVVTNGFGKAQFDIYNLLRASQGYQPHPTTLTYVMVSAVLLLLSFPLYYSKGGTDDVL